LCSSSTRAWGSRDTRPQQCQQEIGRVGVDLVRGLETRSLDPTGTGRARWTIRWKPVLNAFAITFGDRWPAAETY
jgi:hypothetical protein